PARRTHFGGGATLDPGILKSPLTNAEKSRLHCCLRMSAVPSSLSSQRNLSRIALWVGIGLLIAAIVVFVVRQSHDSGSSSSSNNSSSTATHSKASALNPTSYQGQRQADVQTTKKWSQLDPKAKVAVRSFIFDGAGLDNLARAWRYTDPSIRQGFTFNQWIHAKALPFQVFPELNRT